jgi:hypothetical protein
MIFYQINTVTYKRLKNLNKLKVMGIYKKLIIIKIFIN